MASHPVLSALDAEANRVADELALLIDTSQRIPHLEWTVGDTAAHLTIVLGWAIDMARGGRGAVDNLQDMASVNAASLAGVPTRNGAQLAALLRERAKSFVEAAARLDPDQTVKWHTGHPLTVDTLAGIYLGEVVVHGYDIARGLGRPWAIDQSVASLILQRTLLITPLYVNTDAARGFTATYEIRLRRGPTLSLRFADGALSVHEGAAQAADCRISADPVAFLLVGYGRIGQWGPIVRGQLVAWGRKPWLGPKFARLLRHP
jgi:uncharacterized protein (TIGR03083 family)